MNATFSACGKYRHILMVPGAAMCGWVMLNPSQAGRAGADGRPVTDPTNNRVLGFSRMWGYDGYSVANAYDLVATEPRDLWTADAPVSAANEAYLLAVAGLPLVVVAWGRHARRQRVEDVTRVLRRGGASELWCLGVNDDGSPKHPLYLPYTAKLQRWPV